MGNVIDNIAKLDAPPLPTQGREEELCAAYLQRCDRAGLYRREVCKFGELPWKVGAQ